jgi:hypothetical protein
VLFLAHICYCTCTLLTLRDVYATRNVFRAAFNKLSGDLGQKVEAVTTEVKHLSETVATSPLGINSGSSSDPSAATDRVLSALLSAAKDLPPLDRKDFKLIVHWFPTAYRELRKGAPKTEDITEDDLLALEGNDTEVASTKSGSSKKKKDPTLPAFLEDKDGKLASRDERAAISALARSFWQYLLVKQRAPKTSRKVDIEIKLQFQRLMETNFECLRYCDNHWKVDQLWIGYYPSWLKTALRKQAEEAKKAAEAAAKAAEAGVIDVDADSSNGNEDDDEIVEVTGMDKGNKRASPDGGETNKSKRPRMDEPDKSAPAPATVTTKRARVCAPNPLTICLANDVQVNTLYFNPDYTHVRSTRLTLL